MARPLQAHHNLPTYTPFSNNTTLLLFLALVAAISSMIMFLCTTHSKMTRKERKDSMPASPPESDSKHLWSVGGSISSKALVLGKLVSWKKGEGEAEAALWKKSIIMGEKCRPLDFSGQILYDSEGNQVAQLPLKSQGDGSSGTPGA